MAIVKLPTDYVDSVTDKHKYLLEQTEDGCYLVDDVSEYSTSGSYYGAYEINQTRNKINEVITESDKSKQLINQLVNGSIQTEFTENSNQANESQTADNADTTLKVNNAFTLAIKERLAFVNNVYSKSDTRIKADSLAEVYFDANCIEEASKSVISVETYNGEIRISCGRTPKTNLYATIIIRLV